MDMSTRAGDAQERRHMGAGDECVVQCLAGKTEASKRGSGRKRGDIKPWLEAASGASSTGRGGTATPMASVPTELFGAILSQLDVRDLLICRAVSLLHTFSALLITVQVCSLFRALIDSLPSLQYKIELAIAGQEDGVGHSLSTRRRLLRRHQLSWDALHWTQDLRFSMFRGGLWELYGNVLAQITSNGHTLHFKQLPSQSRAIEEKAWTVNVTQFRVRDFAIDPAQDLLIIVEQPQGFVLHFTDMT
jgi:hypothetical protein